MALHVIFMQIWILMIKLAVSIPARSETEENSSWQGSEGVSDEVVDATRIRLGRSQYPYNPGNDEYESNEAEKSSEDGNDDSAEYSYDDDTYWALPPRGIDYRTKPISAFLTVGSYPYLLTEAQYHAKPVPGGYSSPWVPIIPAHAHPVHQAFHL